ncbi:MAG: ABC transporter substrate-binding protein [Candidatus Eiseniibacteriota bacterium]
MRILKLALFVSVIACAWNSFAGAERHAVLHASGDRLFAAWSDTAGAAPGRRALLRGPSGEPLDTVEVSWSRDAITALVPVGGRPLRVRAREIDSLLAPGAPLLGGLWIEPLSSRPRGPRGTFRVPLTSDPSTFDPALVTSLAEKQIVQQVYEGLVRLDARLAPAPGLAERFARDGRVWTFDLRPNARFHDGRRVQAADVARSLERALASATRAPRADGLAQAIEGGEEYRAGRSSALSGVRATDSLTVAITVVREDAPLLAELAAPAASVVSPGATGSVPIGTGPFRFVTSDSTGVLLVAARERTSGVDTLRFRRVKDPAQAVLDFELGRLDLIAPPETEERRIRATSLSAQTLSVEEASLYYLGFNTRTPFLRNAATRRALAGSIDRALAVRVLVPDRSRVAHGLLPPALGGGSLPESAWRPSAFEAEARARALAGKAPALSFWVPEGSAAGQRFAEFAGASLRRLGYRVSIVVRPWEAFQRGVLDGRADLFYLSWFADGPNPVGFVSSLIESGRRGEGGNRTFYTNPDVDHALERARSATSNAEVAAALREAERKALYDAPLVPLFHSVNVTLVRPGISGVVLDPLGAPRYDEVEVRPGD